MADVTVAQFAEVLKVPVDRLLQQLDQAGIKVDSADDMISEDAKHELLTHLRRSHGHDDVQVDAAHFHQLIGRQIGQIIASLHAFAGQGLGQLLADDLDELG